MSHFHVYPFPNHKLPYTQAETDALDAVYYHEMSSHNSLVDGFLVATHDHDDPNLIASERQLSEVAE